MLKHESGSKNKVASALSRRTRLLFTLAVEVTRFENLKDKYSHDKNFGRVYGDLAVGLVREYSDYSFHNGCLFRRTRLFIPNSYGEFLVWELHSGGFGGHFA